MVQPAAALLNNILSCLFLHLKPALHAIYLSGQLRDYFFLLLDVTTHAIMLTKGHLNGKQATFLNVSLGVF